MKMLNKKEETTTSTIKQRIVEQAENRQRRVKTTAKKTTSLQLDLELYKAIQLKIANGEVKSMIDYIETLIKKDLNI